MNKDQLTTLSGVGAALPQVAAMLLPLVGVAVDPYMPIIHGFSAFFLAMLGYFTNKK